MTKYSILATAKTNNFLQLPNLLRYYSSTARKPKEEIQLTFKESSKDILEKFQSHEAMNHPFFKYLIEQSKVGFNPMQYETYRSNFFRRTELTIPSVAQTAKIAALNGDVATVAQAASNMYDEGGYGNPDKAHSKLLLDSHNIHGEKIFGLFPFTSLSAVKISPALTPEVEEYRKMKKRAFTKSYPYLSGNTWAHELAADDMLKNFKRAFFDPYKGYYTEEEYKNLTEFFTAHFDESKPDGNVEEQHAQMAEESAIRACKENLKKLSEVEKGGLEFLNAQSKLWYSILREMEKAQNKGQIVPPKTEFLKQKPETILEGKKLAELIQKNKQNQGDRINF